MKMTGRHLAFLQIPVPNVNGQRGLELLQAVLEPAPGSAYTANKLIGIHGRKPVQFRSYYCITPGYSCLPVFDYMGRAALAYRSFYVTGVEDATALNRIKDFQKNLVKSLDNFVRFLRCFFRYSHLPESDNAALVDLHFIENDEEKTVTLSVDDIVCLKKVIEHGPSYKRTLNAYGEDRVKAIAGTTQNFLETAQQKIVRQSFIDLVTRYRNSADRSIYTEVEDLYEKFFPEIPTRCVAAELDAMSLARNPFI